MAWWGTLIGGAFGFMLGGPLGAFLGASIGHRFDGSSVVNTSAGDQERVQAAFFTATFAIMGHVAKADGRVSRDEITLAEHLMKHLALNHAQKEAARNLFQQGTQPNFPLEEFVVEFKRECHRRQTLIQMFITIQIQVALADGRIDPAENHVLQKVAQILGITSAAIDQIIKSVRSSHTSGGASSSEQLSLADACNILGVRKDAPLPEVRKAYRRLRGQHHPDKLVSKGLPEEMIKLANEKTHEIRQAWERVKQAHQ